MDYGLFLFIVCVATILFVIFGMRSSNASSAPAPKGTESSSKTSRLQTVEDIKMTKTSRVVDQLSILEELEETTPNYRQYCELVGTAQHEGGVVAPYSRRQVAYYEISCYRIENRGSGDVETLVAHEKSFDPFYFKDSSCDTPIYVDIASFGDNVLLINSTNHIEGPNSDFSKAVAGKDTASSTATSGVSAIVGEIRSGVVHGFGRARDAIAAGLFPQPVLAFAGAAATPAERSYSKGSDAWRSRISFAHEAGSGAGGSARFSSGAGRSSRGGSSAPSGGGNTNRRVDINVNVGGMPTSFGAFMGGSGYGYSSVPRPIPRPVHPYPVHTYRRTGMGDVMSDMITGMVLSSVLDSMAHSSTVTTMPTVQTPQVTFRGYRLVEDVVPLGSPVYCIREIYHHGTDVYMGRSLATNYPTSYFATRPETEVLAALGA
jgi:hypothetical protein